MDTACWHLCRGDASFGRARQRLRSSHLCRLQACAQGCCLSPLPRLLWHLSVVHRLSRGTASQSPLPPYTGRWLRVLTISCTHLFTQLLELEWLLLQEEWFEIIRPLYPAWTSIMGRMHITNNGLWWQLCCDWFWGDPLRLFGLLWMPAITQPSRSAPSGTIVSFDYNQSQNGCHLSRFGGVSNALVHNKILCLWVLQGSWTTNW